MHFSLGYFAATLAFHSIGQAAASPLGSHTIVKDRRQSSCENLPTSRKCWGEYSIDTDVYETEFHTGVTREYWLTTEISTLAPDGYQIEMLTINGSMPGPLIEANWGDELVIHVTNNNPDNGTAIHWHGIHQRKTSFSDGVPGITQCPIAPGNTMTYRFHASQHGTGWYHSHFGLQLAAGMFGPLLIHGPATANYDVDLGHFMLQDWFHESAYRIWETLQRRVALIQPSGQNGLINGMNTFDCGKSRDPACLGTGKRLEVRFEKGKKYRLRIVGSQVDGYMKFAIDGHKLKVIAADFVPIVPYETDAIILASGQRYDVIVDANQDVGNYWMRAPYQTACNLNNNDNKDNILAIVRYDGADEGSDPETEKNKNINDSCGDEPYDKLVPWTKHSVGASSTRTDIALQWYYELDLVYHWTLNTKTLIVNWSDPTILDIYHRQQTEFPRNSNVFTINHKNEWVYWVVKDLAIVNAFHPMHLHGHDFYILAQGRGPFVPGLTKLNTNNPPRRDTASLLGNGYTVIAFKTDNPGSWLFHCHIAWHASQGLALQLVERHSEIAAHMSDDLVSGMDETCADWGRWYPTSRYKQDDSGI